MLDCFGLPLLSPSDFGSAEPMIARVHDGLSKSTAHFTYRTNHFFDAETDFLPSVEVVLHLLHDHFFGPQGDTEMPSGFASMNQLLEATTGGPEVHILIL